MHAFRPMLPSVLGLVSLWFVSLAGAAEPNVLWQIGRPDGGNAEFALAPGDYGKFRTDGFFVVGRSDPSRDWPYVHPGPVDGWAGGGSHTFTVVFGVTRVAPAGEARLRVALLDTHAAGPPKLEIRVNETVFERTLAAGAGDASVQGEPARGKPQTFEVIIPPGVLKPGDNIVRLTTTSGSWLLYDALSLEGPPGLAGGPVVSSTVVDEILPLRALRSEGDRLVQPVRVGLRHFGEPTEATVTVEGSAPVRVRLGNQPESVEVSVPAVTRDAKRTVRVEAEGRVVASREILVQPVRHLTIYVLPHSHTDIGYTAIQTAIEAKQVENLRKGIEYARRTAGYPEGARFVWNVEVLWAADLYLRRLPEAERAAFFEAVRRGQVVLNGMYLNELTGLCRPEELMRLFRYAPELAAKTGVPIDSVMISDVPGYTWGTVTAMAQAGIRYFSTAPNYFDRIGDILRRWENKPFWWVGPSGRERVLVWIPYKGYAMSHIYRSLTPTLVNEYQAQLEKTGYPYDIAHMRWSGHGDNAEPDPSICEFVKDWNTRYAWPRFVIAGTGEAFRAFEQRYGDRLPEVRGDWTPYWEDGAGSSALETAMNRASSDRVTQAESLFAMLAPARYPAADFTEAWNKVLLYSEHTWGAWCSVSDPEAPATREQWEIKQSYALEADRRSREVLERIAPSAPPAARPVTALQVFNTTSWPRADFVTVPAGLPLVGSRIEDDQGRPVPSQRLSSGALAFPTRDVPPFASRGFRVVAGPPAVAPEPPSSAAAAVVVGGDTLDNGLVRVRVDRESGAIVELTSRDGEGNRVDLAEGQGLNEYLFLPGNQLADLRRNEPVRLRVGEVGPLVGSLVVESEAPGCRRLIREIRLVAGGDFVELVNTVDKERAATPTKPNDWDFAQNGGKESVNFGFAFRVPDGQVRLDLPVGVIRPDADQMPSACKNWFTLGRWADVSNRRHGVAWVSLDAPLVQVGGITARMVGSQSNPDVWLKEVGPTRKLYAWVMNNHWGTNYRSYQEGPVTFRFLLRPHGRYDPAENTRFAIAASQPLVVVPTGAVAGPTTPRLRVEPSDVVVTGFKPSDDGRALIVRLYGASDRTRRARLTWSEPQPTSLAVSDLSERPLRSLRGSVEVPAHGVVTLRAELPAAGLASR
jgi:alpha-mannosidase